MLDRSWPLLLCLRTFSEMSFKKQNEFGSQACRVTLAFLPLESVSESESLSLSEYVLCFLLDDFFFLLFLDLSFE